MLLFRSRSLLELSALLLTTCFGVEDSSTQRANATPAQSSAKNGCRVIPSDPQWPSPQQWAELNKTVNGRLVATIPIGAPCYKSTYDVITGQYDLSTYNEAACAKVKAGWHDPAFHERSSSSIMQTYFAQNGCNPIAVPNDGKCGLGSYIRYAINVAGDEDVAFAQKNNVRLLIRNTGHE